MASVNFTKQRQNGFKIGTRDKRQVRQLFTQFLHNLCRTPRRSTYADSNINIELGKHVDKMIFF